MAREFPLLSWTAGVSPAGAGETPALQDITRFYSAWPLAERYEALIRAFNDPAPFARRLAKRLHALPHMLTNVLRAPPEYEHRVEDAVTLTASAERAWPPPDSS